MKEEEKKEETRREDGRKEERVKMRKRPLRIEDNKSKSRGRKPKVTLPSPRGTALIIARRKIGQQATKLKELK